LIVAGRAREVVSLYDAPAGLFGFSADRPPPTNPAHVVRYAPTVAAALFAVGRDPEARRLLQISDRQIGLALRRSNGEASAEFWGESAATWAMIGKADLALAALERAVGNGWLNADLAAEDLPDDLGSEPAFRTLVGRPRFERLRASLNRRVARERAELLDSLV